MPSFHCPSHIVTLPLSHVSMPWTSRCTPPLVLSSPTLDRSTCVAYNNDHLLILDTGSSSWGKLLFVIFVRKTTTPARYRLSQLAQSSTAKLVYIVFPSLRIPLVVASDFSRTLHANLRFQLSFEPPIFCGARSSPPSRRIFGSVTLGRWLYGGTGRPFSRCVICGPVVPRGQLG